MVPNDFSQVRPLLCVMLYKHIVPAQEHCIKNYRKSSFKASAQQSSKTAVHLRNKQAR